MSRGGKQGARDENETRLDMHVGRVRAALRAARQSGRHEQRRDGHAHAHDDGLRNPCNSTRVRRQGRRHLCDAHAKKLMRRKQGHTRDTQQAGYVLAIMRTHFTHSLTRSLTWPGRRREHRTKSTSCSASWTTRSVCRISLGSTCSDGVRGRPPGAIRRSHAHGSRGALSPRADQPAREVYICAGG